MFMIPDDIFRTTIELHGEAGQEWVNQLPALLVECEQRWSLTLNPPFPQLSYNYAAPAVRADGATVVVKVGFPGREFHTEAEALRLYDGQGAVQLLEADFTRGVLLLERLEPGTLLSSVENEEAATSIAATLMQQLWRSVSPDHPFPTIADWAKGFARLRACFAGTTGPFPEKLVVHAESLYAELGASMAEPVLLHGDFHHGNVLAAQRQPWLAIDPKGLVGEPAYDTGSLLRNPYPQLLDAPQPGRILAHRIDQLSEQLGFERARVRDWGFAQAILSSLWTFEDHGHVGDFALTCAELLDDIKI